MTTTRARCLLAVFVAMCTTVALVRSVAAQATLAQAKELYASAAYEEALAILGRADIVAEVVEVDQYRALCLLALGRNDDATQVIERIVEKSPSFEPSLQEVSPRIQEAFRSVRRRVLPGVVRQVYATARAAYDGKDYERAKAAFESVVTHVDALEGMGSKESSDLRVLSAGFLDLIAAAMKPAPTPEPPAVARTLPAPSSAPANLSGVYDSADPDVVPPVAIAQVMPPWRPTRTDTQTYEGFVTVLIDEKGTVTETRIIGSLRPAYEESLRRAAAGWRFQPATLKGVPVKYRKVVAIRLTPDGRE